MTPTEQYSKEELDKYEQKFKGRFLLFVGDPDELNIDKLFATIHSLDSRLADMEKYSKRWTLEQLRARKENCVEKCEHEPELIIDYGDGTRHCLHCVADQFWEREASIACAEIEQSANDDIAKRICDENASLTRQLTSKAELAERWEGLLFNVNQQLSESQAEVGGLKASVRDHTTLNAQLCRDARETARIISRLTTEVGRLMRHGKEWFEPELARLKAEVERLKGVGFPIMADTQGRGCTIPWEVIAPYEKTALENHDQTLRGLAGRGGLDSTEAMAVLTARSYRDTPETTLEELLALVRERQGITALKAEAEKMKEHNSLTDEEIDAKMIVLQFGIPERLAVRKIVSWLRDREAK